MTDQPAPADPMAGMRYAGFWVRFLALLIDAVALGLLTTAVSPFFGFQINMSYSSAAVSYTANAIAVLIGLIYFVAFWAWRGQTVGMIPFDMQVVGVADGKKIDWVRAFLRYVGLIIAIIPFFLGLIWVAFDPRRQGWHDKIAGTVVVRPN